MKKTLVAIAALAAATGAMAQSSVELYGVFDVAYKQYLINDASGKQVIKSTGISDGTNAGDRIGFRGTEDLGGGKAAKFVGEFGITVADPAGLSNRAGAEGAQVYGLANTGNTPLGAYSPGSNTRQAYVAYADEKYGELRAGYQYTTLYDTSTNSGFWIGQEQAGGIAHKLSNAEFGGTRANGLVWVSPKFANTTTVKGYIGAGTGRGTNESDLAAGEGSFTKNDLSRKGVSALFEQGPLRLEGAYTAVSQQQALGGNGATTNSYNAYGVATATSSSSRAYNFTSALKQLNASYDLGFAKPVVQYYNGHKNISKITNWSGADVAGAASANGIVTAAVGDYRYNALTYGTTVPYGAATFFIQGGKGTVKSGDDTKLYDYKQHQVGVRYALSKRSTAYVATGAQQDNGSVQAADSTQSQNSKYTAVGLVHSF